MSDETAPVTTAADQTIAEAVDTPSTHVPAVGGVNEEPQVKDETTGKKVCCVTRHLPLEQKGLMQYSVTSGLYRKPCLRHYRGRGQGVHQPRTRQCVSLIYILLTCGTHLTHSTASRSTCLRGSTASRLDTPLSCTRLRNRLTTPSRS